MSSSVSLGIIGSGPSALFLLKHLLDHRERLSPLVRTISIYEKSRNMGMGMPYSPEMTDIHSMSNISSEELPELVQPFADWLRQLSPATLSELGIKPPIDESEVYPRLALGRYLQAQYESLISLLMEGGIEVHQFPGCKISDIRREAATGGVTVITETGSLHRFDRVVIATGHRWPQEDEPDRGYYASPWPIHKLMPEEGEYFNFPIGTLGASLSAFDVINSLAHRHGEFISQENGVMRYEPHSGAENFRIVMHSSQGLLPHLQFAQEEAMREIYRHVSRVDLLALVDAKGFLRLERYFDKVCRPTLIRAFGKDGIPDMVELLSQPSFHLRDFVEKMTDKHDYADAFEGMRKEMVEARDSVLNEKPIHWKEYMDDLMYTLNFHAELMPAEDHITLAKEVMPFLMNVIAAMPLPSGATMLALHDAGKLDIVSGNVEIEEKQPLGGRIRISVTEGKRETAIDYDMFIDCSGQKALETKDYPFQSLVDHGRVRGAAVAFSDDHAADTMVPEEKRNKITTDDEGRTAYLVGGLDIDPRYRIVGADGKPDTRLYEISFPLTTGLRPYSYGLQACGDTARLLVEGWMES